jgi:hypothetical protein
MKAHRYDRQLSSQGDPYTTVTMRPIDPAIQFVKMGPHWPFMVWARLLAASSSAEASRTPWRNWTQGVPTPQRRFHFIA